MAVIGTSQLKRSLEKCLCSLAVLLIIASQNLTVHVNIPCPQYLAGGSIDLAYSGSTLPKPLIQTIVAKLLI